MHFSTDKQALMAKQLGVDVRVLEQYLQLKRVETMPARQTVTPKIEQKTQHNIQPSKR